MIQRLLSFIFLGAMLTSQVQAATFYRHPSFQIDLQADDNIVVNYDMTDNAAGISCTSAESGLIIHFSYKGREKTASLPVILQSHHVPQQEIEELADSNGQFKISFNPANPPSSSVEVNCSYLH